jgi:putative FmdB family regulatory protein
MPTYEYRCAKCGEDLEVYQSFSEEPLKKHAGCGGKLTKVLSSVGIVLKGSGFYKTDNRESGSARKAREEASGGGDSSGSNGSEKGSDNGSDKKPAESGSASGDSSKSAPASEKKNGEKKRGEQKSGEKKSPAKSASSRRD